jgi:hypothetical protein
VVDQNPKRHFPKSVIQVASAKGLIMLYQIPAGFAPSRPGTLELRTAKVVGVCRLGWDLLKMPHQKKARKTTPTAAKRQHV